MAENISPDFPFESQFVEVKGSRMHYVEQGDGDPIVLLHGNPTSSYLWRNVIPHLSGQGRCIALDLIGMGKSDQPDIDYRVATHAEYVDAFIESLGLRNLRFVLHDWGGYMGMNYAAAHPDNVRAIAMMETVTKPVTMADRSESFQQIFGMMRGPKGRDKVMGENFFVERILPGSVMRKLTDGEMAVYRAPFATEQSRKPTYVFPNEIPLDGNPSDVVAAVEANAAKVAAANLPMLLLTFDPGAVIGPKEIDWCRQTFSKLEIREMGAGIHFVQEDQPEAIGKAIAQWLGGGFSDGSG